MCLIVHGHIKLTSRSRYVQVATLAGLEAPVALFDHVCFGRRKSFRILLAIDEPFVFRLQIRACVRILSKIEAHATALQDHSMGLHVVSASPSAAPWMCTWYWPFLQLLHWKHMFCMLMMVCLPAQVRLLSARSEQNSEMSTAGRNVFPYQC